MESTLPAENAVVPPRSFICRMPPPFLVRRVMAPEVGPGTRVWALLMVTLPVRNEVPMVLMPEGPLALRVEPSPMLSEAAVMLPPEVRVAEVPRVMAPVADTWLPEVRVAEVPRVMALVEPTVPL